MMQKYKVSVDIGGLLLFLLIMIPNFIWFAIPAPHDILREESVTPFLDMVASACQILFAATLCCVVNKKRDALRLTPLLCGCIGCGALYYAGWILYYLERANLLVILLLIIPPCLAFLLFAIDRKNFIAVIPVTIFSVCHLIYGIVNFIIH